MRAAGHGAFYRPALVARRARRMTAFYAGYFYFFFFLKLIVDLVTVLPAWAIVSLVLSGLCLTSSFLPVPFRLSLTVSLLPPAIVTVSVPTMTVFLVVLAEAAMAVSLPFLSVSRTERVSVIVHEPLPEQLTGMLAVVPEMFTCPTDALPGLVELVAVIAADWPLLT